MDNKFVATPDNGKLSFDERMRMEYVNSICEAIRSLGTGDAATSMGGLELLAKEIQEGSSRIATALEHVAEAIAERG
jgi:hypothetical protein